MTESVHEIRKLLANATPEALAALPPEQYAELEAIIDAELWEQQRDKLFRVYPEEGPLCRSRYPKHMAFYAAGAVHQERALMGANRVGKTFGVSYECACHLTGWYPNWWVGRRFDHPVDMWAAGEDTKSVRESLQITYLGKYGDFGTGLLPARAIINAVPRGGVPESIDIVNIRHTKGTSRLMFKSYDQGRESFQASKIDIMQFDEEPPQPIYSEGLTRTMSTDPNKPSGLVMCGFTPLRGYSEVVLAYMPGARIPT